jgi:lipopolysaccharide/colanic/teichoic acid biosynthesis glycosyltransferase
LDVIQRAMDSLLVVATLPVWLPVLCVVLAATRLGGRGPLFFRQLRMGLDCRPFTIYKVRTMLPGVQPPPGVLFEGWTYACDPRVTRTGALLRRYRLDELPQLWNVLCGDMSLVGPRPEPLEIARRLGEELSRYHERHTVRPGLTGLCQISCVYRDFGTIEKSARKLEYDLEYVRKRSLQLNCRILWRTVLVLLRGEGMA